MRADEAVYAHFLRRRRARWLRSPVRVAGCRVISVGNLTAGGTGKTPTVQYIARHYQNKGHRVGIVSRGYGGTLSKTGAVVSDGERVLVSVQEAGDEPMLHARALPGVAVIIGRDRVGATQQAVTKFGCDVVVLDDAFQFWSLARDADLVLLDAKRPFGNGHLLPRGRLREEPAALQRASGILLTRANAATPEERDAAINEIRRYTSAPLWLANHRPVALREESTEARQPLELLKGQRVVALSALAHNQQFAATLRRCGVEVVQHMARRDHYRWKEADLRQALQIAVKCNAPLVVTTEKDAVKWQASWLQATDVSVYSLLIELQVEESFRPWLDAVGSDETGARR